MPGPFLARWAGRVGWRILGLLGLVGVAVLLLLSVARPSLAAGPQEQIQKVLYTAAAVLKDLAARRGAILLGHPVVFSAIGSSGRYRPTMEYTERLVLRRTTSFHLLEKVGLLRRPP